MSNKTDSSEIEGVVPVKSQQRTKQEAEALRFTMLELHKQGYKRKEIMQELNLSKAEYDYHLGRIKETGQMLVSQRVVTVDNSITQSLTRMGVRNGRMTDIFKYTTNDFLGWAAAKVQKDGYETVAEMIRDILIDIYEEEKKGS